MTAIARRHRGTRQIHAWANADPDVKMPKTTEREKPAPDVTNPSVGRTGKLGRKVEKPASILPSGPSGQKGNAKHQKGHTNK